MEYKHQLARNIVGQFHSDPAAAQAQSEFSRVFSAREQPEGVPEYGIKFAGDVETVDMVAFLADSAAAPSRGEARRLINQGAVEADGTRVTDTKWPLRRGTVLRVGKHRFLRIISLEST
jgi:tyrosyl-tRNA synthetase